MPNISQAIGNLDMESLLNMAGAEIIKDAGESNKATGARVRNHSEKIKEKRAEQLENIKERLNASDGPKGCLKIFMSVFKVFDILLKPLSMMTGGQLKIEIGKAIETFGKMKSQAKIFGIEADFSDLKQGIGELKKFLTQDLERAKEKDYISDKESKQILKLLDDLQATVSNGLQN